MATAACHHVAPPMIRSKTSSVLKENENVHLKTNQSSNEVKNQRATKGLMERRSSGRRMTRNANTMTELRKKILTFRDKLDLPPCTAGSSSVYKLVIVSVQDLHKLYPDIVPSNSMSEANGTTMNQALKAFCDAMRSVGDMWANSDSWMIKCRKENFLANADLEQEALSMIDDMIKLSSDQKLLDLMEDDEDEEMKSSSSADDVSEKSFPESSLEKKNTYADSPETPTSVLPPTRTSYSPPRLLHLRVQAVGKLNPIDLKRLAFHFPQEASQNFHPLNDMYKTVEEAKAEAEAKAEREIEQARNTKELKAEAEARKDIEEARNVIVVDKYYKSKDDIAQNRMDNSDKVSNNENLLVGNSSIQPISNPETSDTSMSKGTLLTPVSLSGSPANATPEATRPPSSRFSISIPPPQPMPPSPALKSPSISVSGSTEVPPPPPPPPNPLRTGLVPPTTPNSNIATPPSPPPPPGNRALPPPPPPPPVMPSNGSVPAPLPQPPMPQPGGAAPPPPPALTGAKSLRPKKAATKLKRSSQIGNLYRLLKGKVEGSSLNGKSLQGRKGKTGSSGGNQGMGMADALAEMTKRSTYFQQIEEDVRNHAEAIREVKKALSNFQSTDMDELLKFHKYVESHLEKLTDETQVLARFEDFPSKKLEAVRMAAALYTKLEGIVSTLQNWKIAPPLNQFLDKAEKYFTKIKGEIDTLERTKDEESKKFQSHKIQFDFGILIRIKELMVDVSASCMELALVETREAKEKQIEENKLKPECKRMVSAKMLWRAFQFAYRVYTFAGGHDDRADKLTRELAQEIETDPQH